MVGEPEANALLAIKRVALQRRQRAKLDFAAPAAPGMHKLTLYFMCDSYLGCDQARLPTATQIFPVRAVHTAFGCSPCERAYCKNRCTTTVNMEAYRACELKLSGAVGVVLCLMHARPCLLRLAGSSGAGETDQLARLESIEGPAMRKAVV